MTAPFYKGLAEYCNGLLTSYIGAKDHCNYLLTRVSQEVIDKYLIGYFPGNDEPHLLLEQFNELDLVNNKLMRVFRRDFIYHDIMFNNHRIVIPFMDVYGEVIAFAGRTILSESERKEIGIQKYTNKVFAKSDHLFNLNNARNEILQRNNVYVVEGQFDCISAYNAGIYNVVALGGSSMSTKQLSLLLRYTDRITLLLDNDSGGQKGRDSIRRRFGKYANIDDAYLPSGVNDMDDFLKNNTSDDFRFLFE